MVKNESPKGAPVVENGRDRFLQANPGPKELFGFTPTQSIGVFDTNKHPFYHIFCDEKWNYSKIKTSKIC